MLSMKNLPRLAHPSTLTSDNVLSLGKPYKGLIRAMQRIGCTHLLDLYFHGLTSCKGYFQYDEELAELEVSFLLHETLSSLQTHHVKQQYTPNWFLILIKKTHIVCWSCYMLAFLHCPYCCSMKLPGVQETGTFPYFQDILLCQLVNILRVIDSMRACYG